VTKAFTLAATAGLAGRLSSTPWCDRSQQIGAESGDPFGLGLAAQEKALAAPATTSS
jgi:hypothetical protein